MTERELALRRRIVTAFAETGEPPELPDGPVLRSLAAQHVVVFEHAGGAPRIRMAHPFAGHREGARVDAGARTWWGNCAWDGLGIVAALGLPAATVTSHGVTLRVEAGAVRDDAVFHIAVPARHWWDDIGFT
jgi:hypothetical protein